MNMTTLPIGRYRFFQRIQPLFLISQMTSKPTTGCWQVFSPSASWSIYFEEGKLIYACYTDAMLDLLYRHLQRLSEQIPTLPSGIDKNLQEIFEHGLSNQSVSNPDYLAICWLVNQKYITSDEAGMLIEQLALQVLEPFLNIQEGSYEFTTESFLDDMPRFCHLDLHSLVKQCQYHSQQHKENQQQNYLQLLTSKARKYQTKIEQKLIGKYRRQPQNSSDSISDSNFQQQDNIHQPYYQQSVDKKNFTVICIDDSPVMLNAVKNFLDEQIFSVIGIDDPLRALMQIIRIKPDIILLDIEMPNLDGYELCSLLRKHTYFQHVPVIMISGRSGLIDRAKAKMVKASGYLTKPFTQVDLLKLIFQHLE